MAKYYVTMTDKFMSDWGQACGKINKLVLACDTWEEAEIVSTNAEHRREMKYVNILTKRPSYSSGRYLVSWHDKSDYSSWYVIQHDWN